MQDLLGDEVYLVDDRLHPIERSQVADAERLLRTRFPRGYEAFITTFGDGTYSDHLRVYSPGRIVREYRTFQEGWRDLQGEEEAMLDAAHGYTMSRFLASIIIMDTVDGDNFVFHPDDPENIFIYRHETAEMYRVGGTLDEVMEWVLEAGELFDPSLTSVLSPSGALLVRRFRYFSPDSQDGRLVSFSLPGELHEEVNDHLIDYCRRNYDSSVYVQEMQDRPPPDLPQEWSQLFVRSFQGAILLDPAPAQGEAVSLSIDAAADHRNAELDAFLSYFRGLERRPR